MVKPPLFVQTVFGLQGSTGAPPEDAPHMKRTADRLFGDKMVWSVLGAGRNGRRSRRWPPPWAEDLLWAAPGRMAASNAEQVTLARKIIEGLGLQVATSDEARANSRFEGRRQAGGLRPRPASAPFDPAGAWVSAAGLRPGIGAGRLRRSTLKALGKRGKTPQNYCLVGVAGFEPATPASRTQCSTGLSHTPTRTRLIALAFAHRKKPN